MAEEIHRHGVAWKVFVVTMHVATVLAVGWLLATRASVTAAVIFLILGAALMYGNMRAAEATSRFAEEYREYRRRRRPEPPKPRLGEPGSQN